MPRGRPCRDVGPCAPGPSETLVDWTAYLRSGGAQARTMNAMVYTSYGPPEVLQLADVTTPTSKDNEVLVRIGAAVVSRGDCTARKGSPASIRLATGLRRPKKPILGTNLAGE